MSDQLLNLPLLEQKLEELRTQLRTQEEGLFALRRDVHCPHRTTFKGLEGERSVYRFRLFQVCQIWGM